MDAQDGDGCKKEAVRSYQELRVCLCLSEYGNFSLQTGSCLDIPDSSEELGVS